MTAILDTCTVAMVGSEKAPKRQAELTFAMARHALVDLCVVFRTGPCPPEQDRLPPEKLAELRAIVAAAGIKLDEGAAADQRLGELRGTYEPYLHALATYFQIIIPPWIAAERRPDNWQGNVRERGRAARKDARDRGKGEHF